MWLLKLQGYLFTKNTSYMRTMCLQSTPCLNVVKILVLAFFLNGCHDKNMFCNNIDNYYEFMHNVKGFCVQLMIKKN